MNSRFEEAQLSFFQNDIHNHDNLAMAIMAMETMLVVGNDGNEGDGIRWQCQW